MLLRIIDDLFHNYDLDKSGTLNNKEEASQLAVNVLSTISSELEVTDDQMYDQMMAATNDLPAAFKAGQVWSKDEFATWLLPYISACRNQNCEDKRRECYLYH